MAFEHDLRAYLEQRDREASDAVASRRIDERTLHRHFVDRLRALERAGDTRRVEQLYREWPGKLAPLARYLEALPGEPVPDEPEAATAFACRAVDAAIDCVDPDISLVDRLEAARACQGFRVVEAYAVENQLVRYRPPGPPQLTELGRVLLRLRGKDAIRWLLTSEVVQSSGAHDPWHASAALLRDAIARPGITLDFGALDTMTTRSSV